MKRKRKQKKLIIDAGSLAQYRRARHPMPPPGFDFKSKKDYSRKQKHKGEIK